MSLEDARARAVPVPDLRLPRSLKDFAKKAIRALQPQGTARKPKTDAATENRPTMTLARCQAPLERAESAVEDAYIAPWTVVELWKQYQHTLASPPPARAEEAAALRLEDFPDQLYETWLREFGSRPLKDFK